MEIIYGKSCPGVESEPVDVGAIYRKKWKEVMREPFSYVPGGMSSEWLEILSDKPITKGPDCMTPTILPAILENYDPFNQHDVWNFYGPGVSMQDRRTL